MSYEIQKKYFRILLTNQEEPTSGRLIDVLSPSTGYEGPVGVPGGEPVELSRFLYAFLYDQLAFRAANEILYLRKNSELPPGVEPGHPFL